MSEPIRKRVVVHGRVQGVFFRDTLRREASAAGVAGWARNRPEGTLETVVEGPPEAVERVVDFCRRGPPRAVVERVEEHEEAPERLAGFSIR